MKSHLNDDALIGENLIALIGKNVVRVEYNADGTINESIRYALVEKVKVVDVDLSAGYVNVMSRFGWIDHWTFVECGLAPHQDGTWNYQFCVVRPSVAKRLLVSWNQEQANLVPKHDRGISRSAITASGEFRQV